MSGIAFHTWGDAGPIAVLLHGIGSSGAGFASVAQHLPDWQVMAWDMPGYASSDALVQDWPNAGDYAEALAVSLAQRTTVPVHLLGHSLGALIAARFARLYPERVSGLTLAAPALGHKTVAPAVSDAVAKRLADFDAEGPQAFAEKRGSRLLFDPTQNELGNVIGQMAQLNTAGHRGAARLLSAGDLLVDVARLTVPTSVIVGAGDVVTPPNGAVQCHAACPEPIRGPLHHAPSAGHALATQAPKAIADAIDDSFFRSWRKP